MATGQRPFLGSGPVLTEAILHGEPSLPSELNPKVSSALEAVILKCLEKEAELRYGSAREIAIDLRRALTSSDLGRTITGAGRIRALAVLPLDNLAADPGQDYFVDGMTELLITKLAQIRALRVISRTTAMHYKGSTKTVPEIARELGVDGIVEGSVLRAGDRVRITAQLIHARSDRHLWARSYERDVRDVFGLQNEVACAITEEIQVTLTPQERGRLAAVKRVDPAAYEAYLKGKFYLNKMAPDGFQKGLDYMQQAIENDPTNPLPYAGLALGYCLIGHERYPDAFARAKAAARKAEELGGGELAEMYLAIGMTKLYSDWDYAGAEKDLQRAMELNPSLGEAQRDYSWYLFLVGRREEALSRMKRAQQVDPLTPLFYADRGWQYWWVGQNDKAIEEARKSLELHPNFNEGLHVLGAVYAEKAMYTEALAAHEKLAAVDPDWKWSLIRTYAQAGRRVEARKILAKCLADKPAPTGAWAGWFLAEDYAALGDKDEAFLWLEAAYKERHSFLPWINDNSAYAPLHADPRFQDMVRRMKVPQCNSRAKGVR